MEYVCNRQTPVSEVDLEKTNSAGCCKMMFLVVPIKAGDSASIERVQKILREDRVEHTCTANLEDYARCVQQMVDGVKTNQVVAPVAAREETPVEAEMPIAYIGKSEVTEEVDFKMPPEPIFEPKLEEIVEEVKPTKTVQPTSEPVPAVALTVASTPDKTEKTEETPPAENITEAQERQQLPKTTDTLASNSTSSSPGLTTVQDVDTRSNTETPKEIATAPLPIQRVPVGEVPLSPEEQEACLALCEINPLRRVDNERQVDEEAAVVKDQNLSLIAPAISNTTPGSSAAKTKVVESTSVDASMAPDEDETLHKQEEDVRQISNSNDVPSEDSLKHYSTPDETPQADTSSISQDSTPHDFSHLLQLTSPIAQGTVNNNIPPLSAPSTQVRPPDPQTIPQSPEGRQVLSQPVSRDGRSSAQSIDLTRSPTPQQSPGAPGKSPQLHPYVRPAQQKRPPQKQPKEPKLYRADSESRQARKRKTCRKHDEGRQQERYAPPTHPCGLTADQVESVRYRLSKHNIPFEQHPLPPTALWNPSVNRFLTPSELMDLHVSQSISRHHHQIENSFRMGNQITHPPPPPPLNGPIPNAQFVPPNAAQIMAHHRPPPQYLSPEAQAQMMEHQARMIRLQQHTGAVPQQQGLHQIQIANNPAHPVHPMHMQQLRQPLPPGAPFHRVPVVQDPRISPEQHRLMMQQVQQQQMEQQRAVLQQQAQQVQQAQKPQHLQVEQQQGLQGLEVLQAQQHTQRVQQHRALQQQAQQAQLARKARQDLEALQVQQARRSREPHQVLQIQQQQQAMSPEIAQQVLQAQQAMQHQARLVLQAQTEQQKTHKTPQAMQDLETLRAQQLLQAPQQQAIQRQTQQHQALQSLETQQAHQVQRILQQQVHQASQAQQAQPVLSGVQAQLAQQPHQAQQDHRDLQNSETLKATQQLLQSQQAEQQNEHQSSGIEEVVTPLKTPVEVAAINESSDPPQNEDQVVEKKSDEVDQLRESMEGEPCAKRAKFEEENPSDEQSDGSEKSSKKEAGSRRRGPRVDYREDPYDLEDAEQASPTESPASEKGTSEGETSNTPSSSSSRRFFPNDEESRLARRKRISEPEPTETKKRGKITWTAQQLASLQTVGEPYHTTFRHVPLYLQQKVAREMGVPLDKVEQYYENQQKKIMGKREMERRQMEQSKKGHRIGYR